MSDFLLPYIKYALTISWSLSQNMLSIGWTEGAYAISFLGFCMILIQLTVILNTLASFSINKLFGISISIVWLLPGVLSIFGISFIPLIIPDTYYFSNGIKYIGEVIPSLFLILTALVFGWSSIILITHGFKTKRSLRSFKNLYDHMLYIVGALTTVLFFSITSNTSFYISEIQTIEKKIEKNIDLIQYQLNFSHSICLESSDDLYNYGISEDFCTWVQEAKLTYYSRAEDTSIGRQFISRKQIENHIPNNRLNDIKMFNKYICSSKSKHSNCKMLPLIFSQYEPINEYINSRYALAIIPLTKSLGMLYEQSAKEQKKAEKFKKSLQLIWFFHIIFGILIGGKIALSTRSLVGISKPIFKFRYRIISVYKIISIILYTLYLCGTWLIAISRKKFNTLVRYLKNRINSLT